MSKPYEPPSDFLKAIVADEVALSGSSFAEANLRRLISMTRDPDLSNRDWATMLLAQEAIDTPEVRDALSPAARDADEVVRAEATLGLARRDPALALPLVREALSGESACMAVFEAATLVAHPSLTEALRSWAEPSDDGFLDRMASEALLACTQGHSTD